MCFTANRAAGACLASDDGSGSFRLASRQAQARQIKLAGTVNLFGARVRGRLGGVSCGLNHGGNAADFGPDPECLRPGGSVLGGSGVIAAEVEEIVDLIVG